jgi:MFS family permease
VDRTDRHGYRRLLWSGGVSLLGTQISSFAIDLLVVRTLHASPAQFGGLLACQTGVYLLAGLPVGVIVDRYSHRAVLIGCDLARAMLIATVPIAAALHALTLGQVYAALLAVGLLSVLSDVARQTMLPRLVSPDELRSANAYLAGLQSSAQLAGPGAAGGLVQILGAPVAVLADAVSYLVSALLLRPTRDAPRSARLPATRPSMRAGLQVVRGDGTLRRLTASSTLYNLGSAAGSTVLLVLLARDLALPAVTIGLVYSAGALGGVVASVAAVRVLSRSHTPSLLRIGLASTAVGAALLPLTGRGAGLLVGAVGIALDGAGVVLYNVAQVTLRQSVTPANLLGRVTASIRTVVTTAVAAGSLAGGALAEVWSTRGTLWAAAVLPALAAAAVADRRLRASATRPVRVRPASVPEPLPAPPVS